MALLFYAPEGTSGGVLKLSHYKLCISNNLKTPEANSMKFHRKTKHVEKVCWALEFKSLRPRSRQQLSQRLNCALSRVSAITHKLLKLI